MRLLFAALLAAAVSLPAAAQQAPADQAAPQAGQDPDAIIVLGDKKDRDQKTTDYVRALADLGTGTDAIARFDGGPLCPAAAGLTQGFDAAITDRMRRVAEAAKIPLAPLGCKPNVLVLFAPDKDAMIRDLRHRYPVFFANPNGEQADIPAQPGPATAWHLGGYVDRFGEPVGYDAFARRYVVDSELPPSRITATIRPVILASFVVIQQDAVLGLTTTQVADYAAMRTFAGADPARLKGSSASTIVTALDAPMGSEVPLTLTPWDMGYLRALYAIQPNHYGQRQRADIRKRIIDGMDKDAGGQ